MGKLTQKVSKEISGAEKMAKQESVMNGLFGFLSKCSPKTS